jgi:hypothetical protein
LPAVPDVQNDDLVGCEVDRVKNQIWISDDLEDADVWLVREMTGMRELLKEYRQVLNAVDDCGSCGSVVLVNIGENLADFGERGLRPADPRAR